MKIKFLNFLKIIFNCKLIFNKPKKADIILYDQGAIFNHLIKKNFPKITFEIFYRRLESINVYVLIMALIKYKLLNFGQIKLNYMELYFKYVNPKIIITSNDIHSGFYQIKNKINLDVITCVCQSSVRLENHFSDFKNKKKEYQVDYILTYSDYFSKFYTKKVSFKKIIAAGSITNNFYEKKNINKKYDIIFISQFKKEHYKTKIFYQEKKLINIIKKYSENKNKKFKIAIRPIVHKKIKLNMKTINETKKNYLKYFNKINYDDLLSYENNFTNYNYLDYAKVLVIIDSTLGLEAVSRGVKILSFPSYKSFSKDNFFVSNSLNYKKFRKKIDNLFSMSKYAYSKKISNSLLKINFNHNNSILKNIIKKHV